MASMPLDAVLVANEDHLANNALYQQLIERQRPDVQFCHQVWLNFPDELARRFPDWRLAGYAPEHPRAAQRLLLASGRGGGVFWDYGLTEIEYVAASHLAPHGVVYQLLPEPWDGVDSAADAALWRDVFRPIALSPVVGPRGYDFTAQEVYAFLYNRRTKVHADVQRWAAAEYEAKMAVWLLPDSADFRSFLGLVYLAQQRRAEAASAIEQALALDPDCGYCWAARGRVRLQSGDRAGALHDFLAAARRPLPDAADWLTLAKLALEAGRLADAQRAVDRGEKLRPPPNQQTAFDLLAAILAAQRGDCRLAAERLDRLRAAHADSRATEELRRRCGLPDPT
jgi:tetratricopeptide (TPR) repeat protein